VSGLFCLLPQNTERNVVNESLDIGAPVEPQEIEELLRAVRLTKVDGDFYRERAKKYEEVVHFITHLLVVMRDLKRKKQAVLLDCGTGRSYLSFVANMVLSQKAGRDVYFIGVDSDERLIQSCRAVQETLGYDNMEFHVSDILSFQPERTPDIVYSLHACDTATDEVIAKGIQLHARFILTVPCCQHELHGRLRGGHCMKDLTKFSVFKDKVCVLLTDGIRALALEAAGYRVKVIEFVAPTATPKNVMLRAERMRWARDSEALEGYRRVKDAFRFTPALERMLPGLFE